MRKIYPLLKNLILVCLIAGVFIGSWLFIKKQTQDRQAQGASKSTVEADGFSKRVTYRDIDESGSVQSELISKQLVHFPKEDSSEFKEPKFVVNAKTATLQLDADENNFDPKEDTPWVITSKQAETLEQGKVVKLRGNVLIKKEADEKEPARSLKANYLTFYPRENRLETTSDVLLEQPSIKVRAKGLKANLEKDVVYFLSNTHIEYEPEQPPSSPKKPTKHLKTNRLVFHPKTNIAHTKDIVVLEQEGVKVQAKGMKANLKKDIVNFLSDTKIIYNPDQMPNKKNPNAYGPPHRKKLKKTL